MESKKKIFPGLLIGALVYLIFTVYSLVSIMFFGAAQDGLSMAIARFVVGAFGMFAMTKLYGSDFRFKGKDFFKHFFGVAGTFFLLLCVVNFIKSYIKPDMGFMQGLPALLYMILFMFSVGFYEEVFVRGVLFNTFRNRFGEGRRGIIMAIIFSAVIFGSVHLINLIFMPNAVMEIISQVFSAMAGGIIFASLYYITNNFWFCAVLHGVYDLAGVFWTCFRSQAGGLGVSEGGEYTILHLLKSQAVWWSFAAIALILLFREFKRRGIESGT